MKKLLILLMMILLLTPSFVSAFSLFDWFRNALANLGLFALANGESCINDGQCASGNCAYHWGWCCFSGEECSGKTSLECKTLCTPSEEIACRDSTGNPYQDGERACVNNDIYECDIDYSSGMGSWIFKIECGSAGCNVGSSVCKSTPTTSGTTTIAPDCYKDSDCAKFCFLHPKEYANCVDGSCYFKPDPGGGHDYHCTGDETINVVMDEIFISTLTPSGFCENRVDQVMLDEFNKPIQRYDVCFEVKNNEDYATGALVEIQPGSVGLEQPACSVPVMSPNNREMCHIELSHEEIANPTVNWELQVKGGKVDEGTYTFTAKGVALNAIIEGEWLGEKDVRTMEEKLYKISVENIGEDKIINGEVVVTCDYQCHEMGFTNIKVDGWAGWLATGKTTTLKPGKYNNWDEPIQTGSIEVGDTWEKEIILYTPVYRSTTGDVQMLYLTIYDGMGKERLITSEGSKNKLNVTERPHQYCNRDGICQDDEACWCEDCLGAERCKGSWWEQYKWLIIIAVVVVLIIVFAGGGGGGKVIVVGGRY